MTRPLTGLLVVLVCAPTARAQVPRQGAVFLTGQAISTASSAVPSGTVLWQQPLTSEVLIDVGATTGRETDHMWSQGHGGLLVRHLGTSFQASLDAGTAPGGTAAIAYQRWRGAVERSFGNPQTGLVAEAMYVRVGTFAIQDYGGGGYFAITPPVAVRINGYVLASEGVVAPAVSGRLDYTRGRWLLMGGGYASRHEIDVPSMVVDALLRSTLGGFVGARVRLGSRDVLATYERTHQSTASGTVITVGLRLPLN